MAAVALASLAICSCFHVGLGCPGELTRARANLAALAALAGLPALAPHAGLREAVPTLRPPPRLGR